MATVFDNEPGDTEGFYQEPQQEKVLRPRSDLGDKSGWWIIPAMLAGAATWYGLFHLAAVIWRLV